MTANESMEAVNGLHKKVDSPARFFVGLDKD